MNISSTIIRRNLPTHRRGDTWDGTFFVLSSLQTQQPYNLSGAIIRADVRRDYDSPRVYSFSTLTSTLSIHEPLSAGLIQFVPQLIDIAPGTYLYDIQITFPDQRVKTVIEGQWIIEPDITI